MSMNKPKVELRVLEVLSLPKRDDQLVVVEILSGELVGGSIFESRDDLGRWRLTSIAHASPTQDRVDLRAGVRVSIGLESVDPCGSLRSGTHLLESTETKQCGRTEEPLGPLPVATVRS